MRTGVIVCPSCRSRFEYERGELADCRPADELCLGCQRLLAILEQSARLAAADPPAREAGLFLSLAEIEQRLRAGRQEVAEFDHAKAAAGDRD